MKWLLPLLFFGDWPQLLGSNRNGIYTGTDVKPPTTVGEGFVCLRNTKTLACLR